MAIRLVATDLDGTLVDRERRVSPFTQAVVARYAAKGVRFVFCTGRVSNEIDYVMGVLPDVEYAVMANGAYGLSLPARTRVFSNGLSMDMVRRIRAAFKGVDHMFEIMTGEGVFSEADKLPRLAEYGADYLADVILNTRTVTADMDALLARREAPVDKVNIFFRTPAVRDRLLEAAAALGTDVAHPEYSNIFGSVPKSRCKTSASPKI